MDRTAGYRLEVLGATCLRTGDREVPLTTAEARLLAGLALVGPLGAAEKRLLQLLWPDGPPQTALQSLRNHVSRVRSKTDGSLVHRTRVGYRLGTVVTVDLRQLEEALTAARTAHQVGDAERVVAMAAQAAALMTGLPFADLAEDRAVAAARARLREDLRYVEDLGVTALLSTGHTDRAIAELQSLTRSAPERESRWALLLTALAEDGRRSEALAVYHDARRLLIEAHGTEPGSRLRRLHESLLTVAAPAGSRANGDHVVGRDGVVAALVEEAAAGRSTVLTGQSGMGKSTVLHMVAKAWEGPAVTLDCQENPWTALGPVQDLLTRLATPLQALGLPIDLEELRPSTAQESWDRPRQPGGMIGRVADVLATGLAELGSTVVLVDDIDRVGPTTRQILTTALHQARVPGIFASRGMAGSVLEPLQPVEHSLGGLDVEALTLLATQRLGSDVEDDPVVIGRWLHHHTGGHPMFAGELLSAVAAQRPWAVPADTNSSPTANSLDGVDLPDSLVASLQLRMARLPAACRPVLDAVAVMDDPIDLPVLRRLVDVGLVTPLVDAGVLTRLDENHVRFAHSLLRRVAYDQIPDGRRLELHHTIGLLTTDPALRAHHLQQGMVLDPHAAIAAMATAGRAAKVEQAYADAAEWFGRAAAHAADHGLPDVRVLDLRLEACDCAHLAGQPGHAVPLLDLTEELLDAGHLDLRRRATVAAVQLGEAVDPGPLQERAALLADRSIAVEDDPAWRARLNATASILHSMTDDTPRCREMFLAALADLDPDDDALACGVLPYAYMALGHPDDLDRRKSLADRLLAAALRKGDHAAEWEAHHLGWSIALMRADGPGLRRSVAECQRLLTYAGDAGRRWSVGYMRAALAAIDGNHDEAEALSMDAMTVGSGVAPGRAMSVMSAQLLALRWEQGRLDELGDTIRYLIQAQPEIIAWQGAGSLILAESDPVMATELFDRAAADDFGGVARDFAWLVGMLVLGGGAARLGDPERATLVAPHLAPYTDLVCWQGSCSYGPVAAVAADLAELCGDVDEARRLRATAADLRRSLIATG